MALLFRRNFGSLFAAGFCLAFFSGLLGHNTSNITLMFIRVNQLSVPMEVLACRSAHKPWFGDILAGASLAFQ